jgi:molybdate transport system substrate-binding protein
MIGRNPSWLRRHVAVAICGAVLAVAVPLWASGARPVAAQDRDILVFAAASLKNALDDAMAAYSQETGGKVAASYAASSALAKQIEQGAPADLFASADLDWMDYLAQRDLIAADTRTNLLGNSIVLVAGKDRDLGDVAIEPGFDLAGLLGDGRLAVADVRAVPAGKYAKAALESLGSWAGVEGRLAQAENVRAALALVSRGEAPLGIVYKTDAAADANVRIVGTFPESSHPPIIYPVAVLQEAKDPAAASAFLSYLRTAPAAKAAFEKQGFTFVGTPSS